MNFSQLWVHATGRLLSTTHGRPILQTSDASKVWWIRSFFRVQFSSPSDPCQAQFLDGDQASPVAWLEETQIRAVLGAWRTDCRTALPSRPWGKRTARESRPTDRMQPDCAPL